MDSFFLKYNLLFNHQQKMLVGKIKERKSKANVLIITYVVLVKIWVSTSV